MADQSQTDEWSALNAIRKALEMSERHAQERDEIMRELEGHVALIEIHLEARRVAQEARKK